VSSATGLESFARPHTDILWPPLRTADIIRRHTSLQSPSLPVSHVGTCSVARKNRGD
jgi:hypothetical protein